MDFEEVKANYLDAIRKYAAFEGRASRPQFWHFVLVYIVICFAAMLLDRLFEMGDGRPGLFLSIAELAQFLPLIAISVRRLHDADRTGWWQLLMITGIGMILLIFFYGERGTPGGNRFGPEPSRTLLSM